MQLKKVLIAILVKGTKPFLKPLAEQILGLQYPAPLLHVLFLEGDSKDGSYGHIETVVKPLLENAGIQTTLKKYDVGYHLPHTSRHLPAHQRARLIVLGALRQKVSEECRENYDYIWWVVSDYAMIPPLSLTQLVAAGLDLVIPYLSCENRGYDLGTLRDGHPLHKLKADFPTLDIVEVNTASAHALASRRILKAASYVTDGSVQEGEMFSMRARLAGFQLHASLKTEIIHAPITGLSGISFPG